MHMTCRRAALPAAMLLAMIICSAPATAQDLISHPLPGWLLQSVDNETVAQGNSACWPAHLVSLNRSVASTSASWDDSCAGGSCKGKVMADLSWEEPPQVLLAGSTLSLNGSFQMRASQSCGSKSFDAALSASYRAGQSGGIIGGWPFVQGWASEGRAVRGSRRLSWAVPAGSNGESLSLVFTARGPGGKAVCTYRYRWGPTAI